ncbi:MULTISPECIES: kynureninase [unclassified Colwellia]|jgi:kynureninase|uniref:kynureninase n=1 Tax=unclassified Colwellia TaxID=196834 RepID=UPI0015F53FAB|nr:MULTISPECIES: kynureninase [unclassified Colwellia]MBA6362872.1 kynureninase [Colwellia sp. BRX8-8]MBA6337184.1 kynureninase [Colwellia sp. BRX8-7]MBA6373338.1 kynureninase [Colwellia sp. BRX8-4]MBA6380838.1 kynureninase [Colwellia sp. BRX10-7]MBA6388785.1 kynureninase [Colwellia sp. BRX10-2]
MPIPNKTIKNNKTTLAYAQTLDLNDPLAKIRDQFAIPKQANGDDEYYFTGNSLGLQPKLAREYVIELLDSWGQRGVKGHFEGDFPWMPYHELLTEQSALLVGGKNEEVVMMNSLTTNLHLMMVSFYQPQGKRTKILIEDHAFPSDHYAVESQLKHHKQDVDKNMLLWTPRAGEELLNTDDLYQIIEQQGDEIALILLPGVQYYTGQVLDMKTITEKAHAKGIMVGFDLAHAVGNIEMELHNWQVDFACWCSYKYLNSGAGSVAGCFVHETHSTNSNSETQVNRFAGWWGHDKSTRFKMENNFKPIATAEGWQLSNPPVLSLAAIRGSLDTIKMAGGISELRKKSVKLTQYMTELIASELGDKIRIITPSNQAERGCQLSLMINVKGLDGKAMFNALEENGVTTDWREPNVIRVAPVPLYNQFQDIYHFVRLLKECLQ